MNYVPTFQQEAHILIKLITRQLLKAQKKYSMYKKKLIWKLEKLTSNLFCYKRAINIKPLLNNFIFEIKSSNIYLNEPIIPSLFMITKIFFPKISITKLYLQKI